MCFSVAKEFNKEYDFCISSFLIFFSIYTQQYVWRSVGAVAQSVQRATPGEEVPGSIPAVAARSLLVGSVSV